MGEYRTCSSGEQTESGSISPLSQLVSTVALFFMAENISYDMFKQLQRISQILITALVPSRDRKDNTKDILLLG